MKISTHRLGGQGPEVGAISLGSWQTWERMLFDDAVRLVAQAVKSGVNMFDTGNYNSALDRGVHVPHNEVSHADVLFGRIVEAAGVARDDYVLAMQQWLWTLPDQPIEESVKTNLFRVGVDYTDVLLLGHYTDGLATEYGIVLESVITDVAGIIDAGLAKAWAFTNWSAAVARRAYQFALDESLPPPLFAQLKYSMARRAIPDGEPYRELFETTELSLQAADVLEAGVLLGRQPARLTGRDAGGIIERIRDTAPRVAEAAEELDATPAQLAIAFSLTHPAAANVLLGVSRIEQLEENLGAVALLERCGDEITVAAEGLCMDCGVVDPNDPS